MKDQYECLDSKKIISAIAPERRQYLSRLDIFESIDSTNSYLLMQAKKSVLSSSFEQEKKYSGWVCLAEQQTQGRGRQGKVWYSPFATNIYCSFIWTFPSAFVGLSALSMACAVMLIRTLNKLGVSQGLGLKWPNDLYFNGRKLAGILLENLVSSQGNIVVIGLGLNLDLPMDKMKAWVGVNEILPISISRNDMVGALLDELLYGTAFFEKQGLKPFLSLARKYDLLVQKSIMVHTPLMDITGLAQGLNEQGKLLLLDQEGRQHQFSYGEVSVKLNE